MEHHEVQRSIREDYFVDGTGSASGLQVLEDGENFEESPPLPFPQRNLEYSGNSLHRDHLTATENEVFPATHSDAWSCVIVMLTFCFFGCMILIYGVYAPENVLLGPHSSILFNPNHLFVESMKVLELKTGKGPMLYGFDKIPPLDVMITWSESHTTILPSRTHKEWNFFLNKGSQINISYSVNSLSSSSVVLIIAEGKEGLDVWLEDPLYPNAALSWNIIRGNGSVQKNMSKSSPYYIALGNLNSEVEEASLQIQIKAFLYNTTEASYQCALAPDQCSFKLYIPSGSAALLTTPGRKPEMANDGWYVKISYEPRWFTYIVGLGGMTVLVLLIYHTSTHCKSTDQERRREQVGDTGPERSPLLSQKDDDLSSWGSSYVSVSEEDESLEDARDGKHVKDGEHNSLRRLCAICFDAPRDCFFLPCAHCVACFRCATRIAEASGTCPICRKRIKKVRKIYTV
ncbi:E3 ubiquitin-protein ligase APD2-like isoform X2 [Primulina eburnea]|uniref:E3 ubiquitin-protein ligase APD2-like isoform X2 n=1 Tax=Primulina eburnea TaxID=1245227 RepID=UPI003C6C4B5E